MRPLGSLARLLLLMACITAASVAQVSDGDPRSFPDNQNKKTQNRQVSLTAQQKHGLRLLRVAEAEAAGLSPEMHAFILWKAGEGYEAVNRQKEIGLLKSAFLVSQEIEDRERSSEDGSCPEEVCYVKRWIQQNVLITLEQKSPEAAEQLLPQADPEIRDRISASLVQIYAANKNLEHAKAMLTQMAEGDWYPYHAAISLMQALPADSPDRLTVFSQALAYFEQHKSRWGGIGIQDLGAMVVRFWQGLPPSVVLEAVDVLLARAKENDEERKMHVGIETRNGQVVNFDSAYEFRLVQVLTVLRQLDNEQAERLLEVNSGAQNMLDRYSQAMQSQDSSQAPKDKEGRVGDIRSISYSTSNNSAYTGQMQSRWQSERDLRMFVDKIADEAEKDPKQALADAMNMPQSGSNENQSPRVLCLLRLAGRLANKNPGTAKSALDEARKNLDSYSPLMRGDALVQEAELYLSIEANDFAKKALEDAAKEAEKLFSSEADERDPNVAFKGTWPSASLWWRCVQVGAKISPAFVEGIIAGISDNDIAGFERVAYADSLLGVSNDLVYISDVRKRDGEYSMH